MWADASPCPDRQCPRPGFPEAKRYIIVREARLYLAGYALLLVISLALHTAILLWVWIIPLLIGQLILRPYLYAEHTGCERTRSAFENTRTTYTGIVMKWFAWNMPYHVEHHAYPSIPFHALPKLNRIVTIGSCPGAGLSGGDARDVELVPSRASERAEMSVAPDHHKVSTRLRACAGEIGLMPKI